MMMWWMKVSNVVISFINALWKNKIAVLVGDYLLSKSVLLSTDHKDYDLLGVISRTIREMSEGELLQLEKARKLDITEDVYYEIIRQKTATLIAACCEIGVFSIMPMRIWQKNDEFRNLYRNGFPDQR
jgi:geranylgeranyl pyrophosphate synthase